MLFTALHPVVRLDFRGKRDAIGCWAAFFAALHSISRPLWGPRKIGPENCEEMLNLKPSPVFLNFSNRALADISNKSDKIRRSKKPAKIS